MDDLEKNLFNLPKPKLSRRADIRIRVKIYSLIFMRRLTGVFHPQKFLFSRAVLTPLLIVIILGGTSAYAYADENITPGNILYPLKKTVENVEQSLALNKTSKVDTLGKFSERRVKEALSLAQEGNKNNQADNSAAISNDIQQTITAAVDNIDNAVKTSEEIKNVKSAKKAQDAIRKNNDAVIQYLDNIGNIAKDNQDQAVIDKVNEAKKAINNYNERLKNNKEQSNNPDNGNKKDSGERKTDNKNNGDSRQRVNTSTSNGNNSHGDFPQKTNNRNDN